MDVIVKNGEKFMRFEVKYGKNARKFIGKIKEIVYLSKEEIQDKVVPTSLFLGLMNIPQSIETLEIV
ncbi:hypothetical protein DFR86_00720 [Acidianus sulfidivorans JP7]|uniref:Uncharacterized protein n=1 Tax=Acidianus sulfidivorans JP7 TaxID=619593 RepID=A0A2U9IJK7_9CREN|nr:hypothetical protein [Acidianus sulfidivorans]AWR96212.1 hypothetical protein DFR86_00720 [Acidianus sulfidivorans JP7]